jgi:hypothetical protein
MLAPSLSFVLICNTSITSLSNTDLRVFTQNLRTNPQVKDHNNLQLPPDFQFSSQNMVGREGFNLFTM